MSEQTAMAEQMILPKHGAFCWNELVTTDLESCKTFYAELFGWKFKKSEAAGDDMEYFEFGPEGEASVGGMFQMTKEFGEMPSHWMNYIAVENVDESAEKVSQLGGKVCVPPTDIPNVGIFCVVNDPSGAAFSLLTIKT